jgi:hypothetical protein
MRHRLQCAVMLVVICTATAWAGDAIPKAAWKRPIGLALENAGGKKPQLDTMIRRRLLARCARRRLRIWHVFAHLSR